MVHQSALVKTVGEFLTAPYAQASFAPTGLPLLDQAFRFSTLPAVPFVAVFLYLTLSKAVFDTIRKVFGLQPKGPVIQSLTIVHSLLLAVYSVWTFYNSMRIVVPYVLQHGFYTAVCDANGEVWHGLGLGYWITHFYLSKFYEFIDTWVILLKGREPMFLQTYHHAGVVLIMWGFVVTQNTACGLILLCLNSFIHSLMYTYYTLAAFGYSSPLKNYLTMAQMVQFLVGITIVTPAYLCATAAQAVVTAVLQAYAVYLTLLFYSFYQESYVAKKKAKEAAKGAAQGKQE